MQENNDSSWKVKRQKSEVLMESPKIENSDIQNWNCAMTLRVAALKLPSHNLASILVIAEIFTDFCCTQLKLI